MSSPSTKPEPEFTRRSASESICMYCYATVRETVWENLEAAERLHASVCLQWPRPPIQEPPQISN